MTAFIRGAFLLMFLIMQEYELNVEINYEPSTIAIPKKAMDGALMLKFFDYARI